MLNLERLRILCAVNRHGSVSGAAEGLHVTTSAISQQMAKLEREVGQQLIARNGRGIRLTDAGLLLARHADRILSEIELAETELEAHRGEAVGEVLVGAFPTSLRGLGPHALRWARDHHPGLRVGLREVEPDVSVSQVMRGELDLAIVLAWSNKPLSLPAGLAKASLLTDVADVALPADHRLADRESIDIAELGDEEWIAWPGGQFCREWLTYTLRSRGIEPRVTHTAEEHHTQLVLVAAGVGVAVAPRLGQISIPPGVVVIPCQERWLRHIYLIWREDADRRPTVQATVAAFRAAAAVADG